MFREGVSQTFAKEVVEANRLKIERAIGQELIEFSYPQVKEFAYRMRDIEWKDGIPSRPLSGEEQAYIVNERLMSHVSFDYWLQRYCLILTDTKRIEPLHPWPSQKAILDTISKEESRQMAFAPCASCGAKHPKIRVILLKSRQVGGTALSEALIAHLVFLNPHTQGVIASDHPDNTLKLYQTLDKIYQNLPGWLQPTRDWNVKGAHMRLPVLDSDVICGAGNQKTTLGQGMNVDIVHFTEVSTWNREMCGQIDEDLLPAFDSSHKHHSLAILESTGAGAAGNWFHDRFRSATNGDSLFKPVFIAWYLRPGWRMHADGIEFNVDTLAMASRVKAETGIELDKQQLSWYQQKRRELESEDKLSTFYQEFPSTIEEAFQTGLKSVFGIDLRAKMRDRVKMPIGVYEVNLTERKLRPIPLEGWLRSDKPGKEENKLIVWEWAKPGFVYNVGVDASYGMLGRDGAAVEVLRVGNKWDPDEQVAEFRGTISPLELAIPAFILGNVYRDKLTGLEAEMVVEINPGAPGIVTQVELQRMNYQNFYLRKNPNKADQRSSNDYGWYTTQSTRPLLTEMGVDYIRKGDLLINSPWFIAEMGAFVVAELKNGRKKLEHAPGYHDDRIISLFMALYAAHEADTSLIADDRKRTFAQMKAPDKKVVDFQTLGISWGEAMEKWERDVGV